MKIELENRMIETISFGASTAAGSKDSAGVGFIGRLGSRLESLNIGQSRNCGIGGQNTNQMVARLQEISDLQESNLVIISLGINDIAREGDPNPNKRVPLDQHKLNVGDIVQHFKEQCRTYYTSQYPVSYLEKGLNPDTVRDYVKCGLSVARKFNAETIDIHSLIDDTLFAQYIHEDGMHFNSEGHTFIADQIWNRLVEDGIIPKQ